MEVSNISSFYFNLMLRRNEFIAATTFLRGYYHLKQL